MNTNVDLRDIHIQPFSWTAYEYNHIPRSIDWFWGLGLLTIVGAIAAIYFGNYLFAIFILVAGFVLILLNLRHPQEIEFKINQEGITVAGKIYEYKDIKGFTVLEKNSPKLLIETTQYFLPVITLPIPSDHTKTIRATLSDILPELELKESHTVILIEKLGL